MDRDEPGDRLLRGQAGVDHVQQQAGALEVCEEVEPEAVALRGALEQARDVEHGDLTVDGDVDNAEHGLDRGERVVRDLRSRVRDAPQQ